MKATGLTQFLEDQYSSLLLQVEQALYIVVCHALCIELSVEGITA